MAKAQLRSRGRSKRNRAVKIEEARQNITSMVARHSGGDRQSDFMQVEHGGTNDLQAPDNTLGSSLCIQRGLSISMHHL